MMQFIFSFVLLLAVIGFGEAKKGPNVLIVMSDDQDKHLNGMDPTWMPNVNREIINQGVLYDKHYCTVAWCCPSRVNLLTGKAAHNTNVTSLSPPYGGWPKFTEQGLDEDYLPIWIQKAGIKTYYAGKFMNGYGRGNYESPSWPKGWDDSSFLIDPWTYNYMKSHWVSQKEKKVENHSGTHTTLVLQKKALNMMDQALKDKEQFFMMIAPVAPHVQIAGGSELPTPPPMFKGKFTDQKAPRTPNFNPDKPSGASWIKAKKKLTPQEVAAGDQMQVHRLENIAGIDYMVGLLIDKLKKANELDNTYIIYTTDNGFHIGNHRLKPGKRCGFEEDINIPFAIKGPNVPKGIKTEITNTHTDVAPTILEMLGVQQRGDFDGQPIAYTSKSLGAVDKHEHVGVEFWDGVQYNSRGGVGHNYDSSSGYYFNGTYKGLRLNTKSGLMFFYNVWCTHEKELYDMNADYYQMNNLMLSDASDKGRKYYGRPLKQLINRLDAMLMVAKTCKQDSCRQLWPVIFPKGQVGDISDAMDKKYDDFFENQPKVKFAHCIGGDIRDLSGPSHVNVYGHWHPSKHHKHKHHHHGHKKHRKGKHHKHKHPKHKHHKHKHYKHKSHEHKHLEHKHEKGHHKHKHAHERKKHKNHELKKHHHHSEHRGHHKEHHHHSHHHSRPEKHHRAHHHHVAPKTEHLHHHSHTHHHTHEKHHHSHEAKHHHGKEKERHHHEKEKKKHHHKHKKHHHPKDKIHHHKHHKD